jgi:DNA-binding Lrp family transcriptional regulator
MLLPVGEKYMVIGLTMIKVRPGYERSAYSDLQKRPEVRNVYRLFGEYNFFLVMQAEGQSKFNQILKEIKDEELVVKTGPIMLTKDIDLANVAAAKAHPAIAIG